MVGGIEIARIFGIRLRLDWSWFAVLLLLTWTFATFDFPLREPGLGSGFYWLLGFAAALLLFFSVLIHELAHATAARSRGIPVERITLFIFGGVAEMRMQAKRPRDEFVLTIVGPLSSLGLAGAFWGIGHGALAAGGEASALLSFTLARLNLILAVFNMVPAFPLDGGRVLRSVLWRLSGDFSRATRWAAGLGRGFGWFLIGWGLWMFVARGAQLAGAWSVFLGWFLAGAASTAVENSRHRRLRATLDEFPVSVALGPREAAVPAGTPVAELVRDVFLARPGSARLVVQGGRPVGVVTIEDAAEVPKGRRAEVPVFEIMHRLDDLPRVESGRSLAAAMSLLETDGGRPVLVASRDGALDPLTSSDVNHWIDRLETLDG